MWAGIWEFIKAVPTLIAIGKQIFAFLHEVQDYVDRRAKAKELEAALKKARETKDTSDVEAIFNPRPK